MNEMAKIELSKDIIEPIVRAQLQASVVAALGRSDQLVGGIVQSILNTQVDSNGNPSRYSSDKPLITWMAEKAVKEASQEAIKEWFALNREVIKKEVMVALKKNQKAMAEKFVMGMCDESAKQYHTTVEVKFGN